MDGAGWRENRLTGGLILDVACGEPLATGLCMPHSPRSIAVELWVLNSGRGELFASTRRPANGRSSASSPAIFVV